MTTALHSVCRDCAAAPSSAGSGEVTRCPKCGSRRLFQHHSWRARWSRIEVDVLPVMPPDRDVDRMAEAARGAIGAVLDEPLVDA